MNLPSRTTACGAVRCPKGDSVSSVGGFRPAIATVVVVTLTGGLVASLTSPTSAAAPCATNTYTRQFFPNTNFSGTPKHTNCDIAVSENWGTKSPGVSGVGKDNFGVRWSMKRDFGSGGPFTFTASGQDGIRVYLDGARKINLWKNGTTTVKKTVNLTIPKGTHTLRIDYANWTGTAAVKFIYTPRTGATVDRVAPLAPTGLSIARNADAKRNVLRWSANKEMDTAGYRVYRRTPGQASFGSPIAKVTGTTFTDTTAGTTTHLYEVRAVDKSGNTSTGTADVSVTGNPAFLRQYFATTNFAGTPKRTDTDTAINENWGTNSPGVSGVGKDNFGVRWQITRDFGSGGPFTFTASGQDGIRVYLDGTRKIDLWKNGTTTVTKTVNLTIPKGTHTLRIDYANWTGTAAVKFAYTPRTGTTVDRVAPLAPTGAKVVYDKRTDSATLSWAPNREMDLANYWVWREHAAGGWVPMFVTDKTTRTDTGLPRNGRPIRYYISVTDRAGNESEGTPFLTVNPVDTVVPSAPAISVSHMADTPSSLKIQWDVRTQEEMKIGGTISVYRSTGDTLGASPQLIGRMSQESSPTSVYRYIDKLPAFDGTTYTYAAMVTDAAGNASPMSRPDSVTPDTVPPPALTGLTATPRADGTVLSWDAPAESGLHYAAARVVRRPDGSISYDSDGCSDAVSSDKLAQPNAMLCAGPAVGQTVTFLVTAIDEWGNHIDLGLAPTVTTTELDSRPEDALGGNSGALTVFEPDDVSMTGAMEWVCTGEAACSDITDYRVERWNTATRTYEPVASMAVAPGRRYRAVARLPLGETSHFRITGTLADGTPGAVAHYSLARGSYV
ncbi:PA14 domain-containing protein [Streptomyces sp. CA-146814]|uniref:PA14 domain-containing protein n=1 Tax=Streptomyces sp. CA-146814 TaxID=3240053 RepID=UPI003D93E683